MNIIPSDDDAPEFVANVNAVLNGILKSATFRELTLIKIDGWFGSKWLSFSGKVIGAIGVWEDSLTIPPFVPNRVVKQLTFLAPGFEENSSREPIHKKIESVFALQRRVSRVVGDAALAWYSGDSLRNGRGSLMAYLPSNGEYWPWYASWKRNESWRIAETKHITVQELLAFLERGSGVLKA
jgi:hypothetical protein